METIDVNFTKIMETELGIAPYDKNIANNKKKNKIPYFEITKFCHKHEITINWILLGESSMKLIQREEELYKIRLIEKINASCGGGGFCDEEAEAKYIYIDKNSAANVISKN